MRVRLPPSTNEGGGSIEFMAEPASLTYADLASFPDDGLRRELLDGELLVSPAPRLRHQRIVGRLHFAIEAHLREHGGGQVYIAPADVVLSERTVLEPDLLFVSDQQLDILTEANVQGAPALVIEVLSDPRIDRVRKRDLYARYGVPEYWIVDPDADRVEVYRLQGDRYAKPEILEPGETLATPLVDGLAVDVAELLRR